MKLNLFRAVFVFFLLNFLAISAYPQWEQTNWEEGKSFFELYNHQDIIFTRIWDRLNGGRVFFTDDNGQNWAQISSADTDIDILSLIMWDNNILAGTWDGFYSAKSGDIKWAKIIPSGIPPETHIWSIAKIDNVLFAGAEEAIYKSTLEDAMISWSEVSTGIPSGARITSIVENGDFIFAGSENNGAFVSTNDGTNWTKINSGLTELNIFELVSVGTKVLAVTFKAGVFTLDISDMDFVSDIASVKWAADETGLKRINCIFNDYGTLFAGTDSNGVYISGDFGQSWVPINKGMPENVRVWSLTVCDDLLFAGTTSGIMKMNPEDINNYTITASSAEGGTIAPEGNIIAYENCSKVFTITAEDGYRISDVLVDGNSVGIVSNYAFTDVNENHTIYAEFAVAPYKITATAGDGGSISPAGTLSVSSGSQHTYEIIHSKGYAVLDVLVDGVSVGAVSSYTFTSVNSNHTITVSFKLLAVYQINCGGNAALPFSSDEYFTGGTVKSISLDIDRTDVINPAPEDVYRTDRRGDSTYLFPKLKSGVTYKVRLHFSENLFPIANLRLFDIKINGNTVLSNLDIYDETGSQLKALVKEFTTKPNVYREIVIEFVSVKFDAAIAGIEIIEFDD